MPTPEENNRSAAGPTRLRELDALRGVAIIAVVALHTTWPYLLRAPVHTTSGRILALLHLAAGLGVPLFIALSATSLTIRYGEPSGWGRSHLEFLARRAWRILPAYALWSAVSGYARSPNLLWPPGRYLSMLLHGSADVQFYFVPLIFELYLLWPLFQRLGAVCTGSGARQVILVVASALVSGIFWWASSTYRIVATPPWWFGFWLLYVGAGIVAGQSWQRLLHAARGPRSFLFPVLTLGILGLCAAYGEFAATIRAPYSELQLRIAVMPFRPGHTLCIYAVTAASFVLIVRRSLSPWLSLLARLGRDSYGTYLMHLLILYPVNRYLLGIPTSEDFNSILWVASLGASFATTLAISAGFSAALANHRWTAWTVGRH